MEKQSFREKITELAEKTKQMMIEKSMRVFDCGELHPDDFNENLGPGKLSGGRIVPPHERRINLRQGQITNHRKEKRDENDTEGSVHRTL